MKIKITCECGNKLTPDLVKVLREKLNQFARENKVIITEVK